MKASDLLALVKESSKGTKKVDGELKTPTYDNMHTPDNHVSGKGSKEVKNAKKDFGKKRDKKNPANPGKPSKGEKRDMGGPGKSYKRLGEAGERPTQAGNVEKIQHVIFRSVQNLNVANGSMVVAPDRVTARTLGVQPGKPINIQMDPEDMGAMLKPAVAQIKRAGTAQDALQAWHGFLKSATGGAGMKRTAPSGSKETSPNVYKGGAAPQAPDWQIQDSEGEEMDEALTDYPEDHAQGGWIHQQAGSDTEHWAYLVGPNKAIVVPVYDGRTLGNAATKSLKNWYPEPKMVSGAKVPSKVKAKIMKKMQQMGHGSPMGESSKQPLSVPERHRVKIAKDTLKMSDAGATIMGGMTKDEARAVLKKHGIKFSESYSDTDSMSWEQPVKKGGPVSKTAKVRGKVNDEPENKGDPGKPKSDGKDVMGDGANLGKIMNPKQVKKVTEGVKALEKIVGRRLNIKAK